MPTPGTFEKSYNRSDKTKHIKIKIKHGGGGGGGTVQTAH